MNITDILTFGVKNGVSDFHISAGVQPMVRVDGDMRRIDVPFLDHTQVRDMIYDIMNDNQRKEYEKYMECDFSFAIPNVARFRVNAYVQNRGAGMVIRTIPSTILTLEQLDTPAIFKKFSMMHKGIVTVTGGTGSGKSTTLAAMINFRNESEFGHILTIEDPIEFVHQSKRCLITQREYKRDTLSFESALRAALRQDPDVILIGELRDLETIRLSLTAAETGHAVFGTLHTSSAAKTIDRLVDVFPTAEKPTIRTMLSESLQAVISQVLLRKIGGGRIAAHEIMVATSAIRNLIRESKVAQMYSSIQTGQKDGMQTLDQCLINLLKKRLITKESARSFAINKSNPAFE
jgi:twitching motility protein PilT